MKPAAPVVWLRHEASPVFCAVDRHEGGSAVTFCNGRMSLTDEYEYGVGPSEVCRACQRAVEGG